MNPFESSLSHDFITLNGTPSPGLCEVVGAGSPRNWDERKGYGLSGSILVFTGNALSKFSVKIRLGYEGTSLPSPSEQWRQWEEFRSLCLKSPKGTRPKALDIYHPFLEALEIKSVVVLDLLQPVQVQDGIFEFEIKFQAFAAPKPSVSTPDGTGTDQPKDEWDQLTSDLTDQFNELAK